ncbi:MAG: hypothetical protein P4L41_00415 [Flavipsychrobacter sp.]|nr:hypothetical protein [Flavipsychrobacter sp.]
MQASQNNFIKKNLWYLIAALLAILMVITPLSLHLVLNDKGPSWLGLDVSWQMTMNYAMMHKMVWGKDIIFNYGPLAFLSTRLAWGISKWIFVVFDVFLLLNYFFVFADFLKRTTSKPLAVIILVIIPLLIDQFIGADLAWLILFFIIYWMYKTFYDQHYAYLTILTLLVTLAFYIKMNTGLIAVIFLLAHLVNLLVARKINVVQLLYVLVLFSVIITISASLLHVSISSYIHGGSEMIKGYNAVMYLNESHAQIENSLSIMFYIMLSLLLFRIFVTIKNKDYSRILFLLISIVYIFSLQKQSVLRNDVQHLYEYFSFAPLILLCWHPLTNKSIEKALLSLTLIIFILALFITSKDKNLLTIVSNRAKGPFVYINDIKHYDDYNVLHQKDKRYIPQHVLDKIAQNTVDIFPWDGAYLLENNLNYTPRPIPQSYSTFTENLEQANYDFYVSKAPEVIIYDYDAIDERYPFNDESLVNMFIGNNYTCVDTFTSNERMRLVLQKKAVTPPVQLNMWKKDKINITHGIPTDHASFIKLDINYTLAGFLKSFWGKTPPIKITYLATDGQSLTCKTSKELLKAGLFTGNIITDNNEFRTFISKREALQPVKEIQLEMDSNYYSTTGNVEFYNKVAYKNDTNLVTLSYRDLVSQDPNQVFEQNGKKVIAIWTGDIQLRPIALEKGKYKLTLVANGTPMDGIYPHLNVFNDNNMAGDSYTTADYKNIDFYFEQTATSDVYIRISMDNDGSNAAKKEDRNAFIKQIIINKVAM